MDTELSIYLMSAGVPEDIDATLSNFPFKGTINLIIPDINLEKLVKLREKYSLKFIVLNNYPTRQNYYRAILNDLSTKYVFVMSDAVRFFKVFNFNDIIDVMNNNKTIGAFLLNKLTGSAATTKDNMCIYDNYNIEYNEFVTMTEKRDRLGANSVWPFCLSKAIMLRSDFLKGLNFPFVNRFFEYHIVDNLVSQKLKIASFDYSTYQLVYNPDEHLYQINVIVDKGTIMQQLDRFKLEYRRLSLAEYKNINLMTMLDTIKDNKYNFRKDILIHIMAHKRMWEDCRYSIVLEDNVVLNSNFPDIIRDAIKIINTTSDATLIKLSNNHISAGYVLNKAAADKLKDFYRIHKMKYSVSDAISMCDINIITSQPALYVEHKDKIVHLDGYQFYSRLDSRGFDIRYTGNLSLQEMKEIADNDPNCIGFNTLGWFKNRIKPVNELMPVTWSEEIHDGLYIKDIDQLVQNKIKLIMETKSHSDLTFTVTTCKRWECFKETMDTLLLKCKNIELVEKWLCVDDNSSSEDREKMKSRYPFFEFIFKQPKDKGHPLSMNILWDKVTTTYSMHFEDDWLLQNNINLKSYLDYVKRANIGQLILRRISADDHIAIDIIDGNTVYKYIYNPNHIFKPDLNKRYDQEIKHNMPANPTDKFWWWPGFSLNPSIMNIKQMKKQIGLFKTDIQSELFEYDYAVRCYNSNLETQYVSLNIQHIGAVSSYSLNDMRRYYDK
jgi:hypothetical protein